MSSLFLPLFFLLFILPVIFGGEGEGEGDGPNSNPNLTLTWSHYDSIYVLKPCNKSREVIQDSWFGRISDGPSNYTHDTTCEWLVKAPPGHWISLRIERVRTECSYDYLFVWDGESYSNGGAKLLGSFSGASDPHVDLLAESGRMLIMLYSDPNYVLEGFQAEYSITKCPLNCSGNGECVKKEGIEEWGCKCEEGSLGRVCQDEDETRVVLAKEKRWMSRVGHSVTQMEELVYVFGGFDLNIILDNLVILDLKTNLTKEVEKNGNGTWPKGRYAHAAVRWDNGFFIHGGRLGNGGGGIAGDLFYFNLSVMSWTKFEAKIPHLMYHSMTLTPSDDIYVYGGLTHSGEFSAKLYKFNAQSPSNWTIVKTTCCGKEIQRSVLGHTMTYWPLRNALILFGGLGSSDYGRFSKLSGQLWIFMLNTSTWMLLDYRRNGGVPPGLYPERAFHTAHVVDQYLTIFGGYTHVHNKDETCYSNQMLVYNLECQIFLPVPPSSLYSTGEVKPSEGMFGHQSVIFNDDLILIGGYRGYLSQSIRRLSFPFTKSKSADCSNFDRWRCSGEPRCGWCPTSAKCFDKVRGAANCTTNLQTVQCPGICPLLTTCQSCVVGLVKECVWCGSLEQCWKQSDGNTPTCNNPLDNSSQSDGVQCAERSWRMGATQYEYRFPFNFTNPDSVKVVNSSILIIPREYGTSIAQDVPVTYALRGSLVGITFSHPMKKLELCALQAAVNLTLTSSEEIYNSSYRWTDYQLCYNLTWPISGNPVYLLPSQRIKFDLIATSFGKGIIQEKSGRVTIQLKYYTGSISSPRVLRKEHLLPYEGDAVPEEHHHHCLLSKSCLSCAADAACIWRIDTRMCIPKVIQLPGNDQELIYNPALPIIAYKSGIFIQPEDCPVCSDLSSCEDCLNNGFGLECEWWEEDMVCHRRGRLHSAVTVESKCPEPCSLRKNCSSCLDNAGKCVWCEQKQECFIFSTYTSVYQYGQCYRWIDKSDMCTKCDKQPTCESCVINIGCGWRYNENGGSCSEGDFGGPIKSHSVVQTIDGMNEVIQKGDGNMTWTYGECPDVNECELGIDDCHSNATCINTPGSFACFCRQGFTGDGKTNCDQTCFEPCIHGTCSPEFNCDCDLGWTGPACSIDCGCNNHSYCNTNGPGTCDQCRDHTTGEHCEQCKEGSYGKATLQHVGCTPCNCNGHGDIEAGLCDPITGHCFCLNNTTGRDCAECAPGFYADPSAADGKPCYSSCSGRGLVKENTGYFGLPPDIGPSFLSARRRQQQRNSSFVNVEHCMWIIRGGVDPASSSSEEDISDQAKPAGLLVTIESNFDIPCSQNVLLLYKGFSEFGVNGKGVPLVAAICNAKEERPRRTSLIGSGGNPITIMVEGTVATIVLKYGRMGSTKFSFNGSFKTLSAQEFEDRSHRHHGGITTAAGMPFNISTLYEGTSQSLSVLSRYGHSLHVDQNNLWVFGGYSLSHGPLNDIRHFSRDSNSWVPLTITVFQSDEAVPPARYFHGAVIGPNLIIYVHGGISGNLTTLSDSWKFDTRNSRWSKFCEGPNESPNLAGHTLTIRPGNGGTGGDPFSIVMLGGFNPEEGFSDKIYSIGATECWMEVETSGSNPLGIYGHTTVYHVKTDSFYIFGGTLHDTIGVQHGSIFTSSRLFVLHWPTKRWSVLSPMEDHQLGPYPTPRFLHTAVSTDEYMVVLGGIGGSLRERNSTALVYVYQCNLWAMVEQDLNKASANSANSIPDTEEEGGSEGIENASIDVPEVPPDTSRVAGATVVWHNEIFLMGGWKDGSTSESVFLLSVPKDPCSLQLSKSRCKSTVGCAFCASNNNMSQQCYNSELEMPSSCSSGASNIEFWKGVSCHSTWLTQQTCGRFTSCTECLATWPVYPNTTLGCHWCTNGKEGKCIPVKKDDTPCAPKQSVITDSTHCPERDCSAPQCEKCTAAAGKCIWTRQILRSRERSWELRLQPVYDWNCVRKSILDTSPSVAVVSSPPSSCPIPCWHFDSCQECLESPGAEGGFHQCFWSVSQRRCISPAYVPLLCFGGICGPILRGSPVLCPKACSTLRSCSQCLENPTCGWCAVEGENGEGVCLPADKVSESGQCSNSSEWHYLKCPKENECTNGHHACDSKSEQCIDLEEGYRCQCRAGYERSDTSCIPICPEGCVHGTCVEPGKCECNFGYVGTNCSVQCDCNGHSMCESVDKLDVCLECKNNTMGPKCSQCKPMFVGDPRSNGACISCLDYCNGHSEICLSQVDHNKWCNGTHSYMTPAQLRAKILSSGEQVGPSTTAFCCHCGNQTTGDTCNDCIPGYFRGYDDKRLPCRKCMCQGHGTICDPITGHDCDCHNNTESEHCTQNTLKQNLHYQCWKHQCSKCRDSYLGTPISGHQCYMQMQMEEFYCFDPKSPEQSCGIKPKPLLSGRTVFFAVQPKFMNVNIRITLDVTHGSINIYLSPKDDTFVIKQDDHNWIHRVEFDIKYGLAGDRKDSIFGKSSPYSGENSNKIDIEYDLSTNKTEDIEETTGVNRIIPKTTVSSVHTGFKFVEHEAAGYATYYIVQDPKAILLVRNLRNRLVITLPQDSHDLRMTRFFLVLEGIGDVSFGSIVFRQDQLHIDLFVFFSVFFSAFFLFLAGCGIAWKVKQNVEARRARHRHVAEMLSMAKRPFAVCTVLLQPDPSTGIAEAYTQCRKSCRKGCICIRPIAVEWASGTSTAAGVCTMLITMPGGNSAPVKVCVGSVLATLQRSHHHPPYHVRRRRLQR